MKKGYALLSVFFVFLLLNSASHEKTRDIKKLEINAEGVNSLSPGALTVDMDFGKFPLYFISNKGQVHKKARFYAKTSRYTLWLTKQGLVFDSTRKVEVDTTHPTPSGHPSQERHTPPFGHPSQEGSNQLPLSPYLPKIERDVSRLMFINADKNPGMLPVEEAKLKVNYFIGNDKVKWHGDVPTSQAILYKSLYKGVDLKVYGIEKKIEYDWMVKPGGNPGDIRFEYQNVKGTRLDNEGNLLIETDFGELVHKKPVGYQNIDNNKCMIKAGFKKVSGNIYGFSVGEYNKDYELIIDPVVLAYSTYLGGGSYEHGYGIKADGSGNVYVTGHTNSTNYPCLDQYSTDQGGCDVIVSKIDTTKSGADCLIYSTYLGGGGFDNGYGIAVDSNGIVYITGFTESGDFPTLNQYQTYQEGRDAFVSKIDTTRSGTGSLIYSTYLGGSNFDEGRGIELDSSGNVYITGSTSSYNFPILNQYQADQGGDDAFIAKIDTTQNGTACLIYSTYLGGSSADYGHSIALDNSGNVYVTGATKSSNFPILNQYQTDPFGWNFDAYVTKIDTTKSGAASLIFSTYLGGKDNDEGFGIAVDNNGNAYVTGYTQSYDFPTRNAYQSSGGGWFFNIYDVFVTRIDTTKSGYSCLIYSTYLGGDKWSNEERGQGIAVDNTGCVYVTGYTGCTDFPTLNQFQTDQGGDDAFVTKIDTTKSGTESLIYSTYLGGGGHEYGYAITLDSSGSAYVTGRTASYDFPVLNQYQVNSDDYWDDIFITKLKQVPSHIEIISPNGGEQWVVGSIQNITWSSTGVIDNVKIEYSYFDGSNQTDWITITSSTLNDGSYQWTVPNTPANGCIVRVSDIDGNLSDTNNMTFTIILTPEIIVTFPNGGEILAIGTSSGITWSTLGIAGDVKIEYSTAGEAGPYTIITAAAANTGTYNGWIVPDEPSTNCFIKISEVDGNPTDISNGPFSIVPAPTISGTVTSGGVGLANVVMSGLPGNPVTNASGYYAAQVSYNWTGTVTPILAGYTFTEPSTTYSNVTTAQTTNYTATIITYTISGTITHGGAGLQNVVMNGLPGTPLTDASGFYTAVVNYGWTGTATPTLAGYTLTPPSTTYTNVDSDQTTDYTAELTDQIPIIERQALIDLYNSTNGDTWINNSGWKTPPLHTDGFAMPGTEWSWHGVTVETDNHVTRISLGSNNLQGTIPASIGDLLYLTEIYLYTNQLTGSIPAEITSLQGLQIIDICSTQLSGPLPLDLGNLVNLRFLYLYSNQLSGEIPISIGNCVELIRLYLDDNQLTGKVPAEIGNLTKLERIDLSGNKLQGPLPIAVTNLTSLSESFTESGYNALYTEDESIRTFMNSKDPDWESTQTIAPSDVSTAAVSEESVEISWTPIVYTGDSGMYVVHYGTSPGGPYPDSVTTESKTVSSITVTNLSPATTYYFVVQTLTEPHENNENAVESDYSEEVSAATLARPALRVTSPNVGENLIVGSTYEITWMSNRVVEDIKIEYSIDNGVTWITIIPAVDNSGSYYWTVPDTPSASCLVRISESDKDNGLSDVSDGGFAIISASFITVKSPNGRETWKVASNQQITWTGTGIDGNVKIEYSTNNGAFWTTITGSTDNNGIFNWFVPDTPSDNCVIRISDIDGAPADVSDNVFSITQPPTITVTSPNGGENWNAGSTHHITWTGSGTISKVKIDYSIDNGTTWTGIAASLDNNGSYPWIVPGNPSDNCLMRISEINVDNGPSDVSNAVFSIIPGPVITIISPNGNESPEAGSVYNITWSSNGAIGEVKIEYSTNNGGSWAVIAAATVNDGSHSWTVPDNPSKSCLIRISETDGEPADISDAVFSIESPSTATITIISPNGGENLTIDTTWKITWNSTGMQANDNVIIEYSIDSGGPWIIIKPSIVNTGSYDWTVPDNPSGNCLIRINGSDSDEGPTDVSDAVFSIEPPETPTITVTSPNGGESLIIGSTHNITWTTSGMESVENIIIEYSTDSGTTWTAIVFSTSDIGSFSWTVPEHPADNCLIRIRVSDRDESPSDISDEVFSIIPGTVITVTSPNGGEQWKTGTTYNITWTSEGITGDVIIDLYRGDTFDLNIGTVPVEQGSFAWNIPGNLAVGDDYKILLHKDTTEDDSDGNFSIVDMESNHPDFNNDGHVDILWRNYVSGNNEAWLMNGPVRSSSLILPVNPDLNWRIVGTGDFNRDGKIDILWRNYTNGQNQVWYMDGSTQTGFEYLTPNPDVNNQIAGTGDFNEDGNIDILWRNPLEGRNQVWHLDGITVTEYKGLPPMEDPTWRIAGIGDFNNDDKADILWRNYVTGSNQVWVMDGTTRTNIIDVPELTDIAWQVAGTGDFNRDGNIDILWRRYADGMNMVWYMDGIVRIGYEYIEIRSDLNCRIVGNGDYKD